MSCHQTDGFKQTSSFIMPKLFGFHYFIEPFTDISKADKLCIYKLYQSIKTEELFIFIQYFLLVMPETNSSEYFILQTFNA